MKRFIMLVCIMVLAFGAISAAHAAKPVDFDGDGYTDKQDCDDTNPLVFPGNPEVCGDGLDNDCDGIVDNPTLCQTDPPPPDNSTNPHATLTFTGYDMCIECHATEAAGIYESVHHQWDGPTPYMTNQPGTLQGKIDGAVNSYCINIEGNWNGCGACHVGTGAMPTSSANPTATELAEVDCFTCHQEGYKRVRVNGMYQPDIANMAISMDEAVQTLHRPTRQSCLVPCHAKAGGGDAVKRGDLAIASAHTGDYVYDVHMSTTGADFNCQSCHVTNNHKIAGKGSDLRPTDLDVAITCSNDSCHVGKADPVSGHADSSIAKHVNRVACQTCHIPVYAKNAADTPDSEATEMHRTWLDSHLTASGALHPASIKANDVLPEYRFWNGFSNNYLKGDSVAFDPATGNVPTSRPLGSVSDNASKLYAFKYKTAEQPRALTDNVLIMLDTSVFFATGDGYLATEQGMVNQGLSPQPYDFVTTDTFQMLNHQVSPSADANTCATCHGGNVIDFAALGYTLKGTTAEVCSQCHNEKKVPAFERMHNNHVDNRQIDCSWCHDFTRPEKNLIAPGEGTF